MKIQGYSGPIPSTSSNHAIRLSAGGQTGGTTYAQGQTQNRNSDSPLFRTCDNLFIFLDSVYAGFPAGPVTNPQSKAAWDAASAAAAGWQVCGCSLATTNGQTFHRCYNYFRIIDQQPITNTAPSTVIFDDNVPISVDIDITSFPGFADITVNLARAPTQFVTYSWNCGQCVNNPRIQAPFFTPFLYGDTGANGLLMANAIRNGRLSFCSYATNNETPCMHGTVPAFAH